MDTITLLERAGFEWEDGKAVLRFATEGTEHAVVVTDANRNSAPSSYTEKFRVLIPRHSDPESKFFDIVFETSDVRDVAAFASAAKCDTILQVGDQAPDELTFEFEGTAIHNAFADETYGDWQGRAITDWPHNADGRAVIVDDPTKRDWGTPYIEWRDAYCAALTSATPTP